MPLVSVIIPAWKAERSIGRAIASARAQTLADIEIIVVNDCSPDDVAGAAQRAGEGDPRLQIINHERNRGPAAARNTAIAAAKGEWIAVLDADDTMAPPRLARLLAHERDADIISDDLALVNEDLPERPTRRHLNIATVQRIDLAGFARNNCMFNGKPHTGYLKPMFRRAFLSAHALAYDEAVRIGEDYMLVATALALKARYVVTPEALYCYRVGGQSLSRRLRPDDMDRLLAADDRFRARFAAGFDAATAAAVAARRASLEDAAAFVGAVEAIKARRLPEAARRVLRRPASLRHFGMPIGVRLKRLTGRRSDP